MSEQGEDKTEQPTPKKIKDSREKGQVAQSKELTMSIAIIVLISSLAMNYKENISLFFNNFIAITHLIKTNDFDGDSLFGVLKNTATIIERFLLLPIGLAAILSFFINVAQIKGLIISKEAFKFDLKKLNPVDNFKSTFSKKNFIKFLRQFSEILVMGLVGYLICSKSISDILKIYLLGIRELSFYIAILLFKIFITLFVIYILFSIVDYILESKNLTKQLMMSLHDIKEEFKNTEGNPEIKYERKRLHQELLEGNGMFGELSNSSILIANPTHIAIIVTFMPEKLALPFVLFKASGIEATNIIEKAKQAGMIIERNIPLARSLFQLGDIGQVVPKSLLSEVADLFGKNLEKMPVLYSKLNNVINPVKSQNQGFRV